MDSAITPKDVRTRKQGDSGADSCQPVQAKDRTVFVSDSGSSIKEFKYQLQADSLEIKTTSQISGHLLKDGVREIKYQERPFNIIWVLTNNGELLGITFDPDERIRAFHQHFLGGPGLNAERTTPFLESIAVKRADDNSYDELWIVARRSLAIVGEKRYIEVMTKPQEPDPEEERVMDNYNFLDSSIVFDTVNSPSTIFPGIDHLANQLVDVVADGEYLGKFTVDGTGTLTLPEEKGYVVVGYHKDSTYISLPLDRSDPGTGSRYIRKRILRLTIRFDRSLAGEFGPREDKLREFFFRRAPDLMDNVPPLFSGEKTQKLNAGNKRVAQFVIKQTKPMPQAILSIQSDTNMAL